MRTILIAVTALGGCLVCANPVRAGIYFTDDPDPWPPPDSFEQMQLRQSKLEFGKFHFLLSDLRNATVDWPNRLALASALTTAELHPQGGALPGRMLLSLRTTFPILERDSLGLRYLKRVTELEAKEKRGELTTTDRINLGACWLRLEQPNKAIAALTPAAREGKPHFLVLANLATAYEMARIPERAISYRQAALKDWPAAFAGWTQAQLYWYRRAEKYHLTLLELRTREPSGRDMDTLDALFPRVRFSVLGGDYKPGPLPPDQWVELPEEALPLVYQLVYWRPLDDRLFWLLGEVLNARGDIGSAATVLQELVVKYRQLNRTAPVELRRHAQVLQAARPPIEVVADVKPDRNPAKGAALAPERNATAAPAESQGWMPDWRQVVIGFVSGALVALLGVWQVREIRRRRQPARVASAQDLAHFDPRTGHLGEDAPDPGHYRRKGKEAP